MRDGGEAMILLLVYEDGTKDQFGIGDSVQSVIRAIRWNEVATIVVGEVAKDKAVVWEKQFSALTVMPTEFAKLRKAKP